MAEGLFRAATKGRRDISVASAGVAAVWGQRPSQSAIQALHQLGIDITDQRSQPINESVVEEATYIR